MARGWMRKTGRCTVSGCAVADRARGLCDRHYRDSFRAQARRRTCRNSETVEERIERYIERDPNSGCWLWTGTAGGDGRYGSMAYRGKQYRAHRLVFQEMVRPLTEGEVVCHSCDTTLCVNPTHLWAGTQGDNMRDMVAKGRARPRGLTQFTVRCLEVAA